MRKRRSRTQRLSSSSDTPIGIPNKPGKDNGRSRRSELVRPVGGAADSGDAGVLLLLGLTIDLEGGAAHLALAVHARHGLHLVQRVLVALQPAGGGVEAT